MNPRRHHTITLPDADYEYYRKLGQGNASQGMSEAVRLLQVPSIQRAIAKIQERK